MGARVLASMAWLALGLITVSPHTTEAGCRWDGTAPACNGKCRADEIEVARIPDRGVKEPDYGEHCLISGKKALCCTRCPSGQVWREAYGTLDVVCVTPDKRYVKDDGTCATGKTCKAIQKPSLAGDWAGKNIDMPGGDYTNFNLNSEHPSDCRDACVKDSQCKAWTYVKPGVQGPKARCWLKSSVPPARSNTCCISEVIERGGIKVN